MNGMMLECNTGVCALGLCHLVYICTSVKHIVQVIIFTEIMSKNEWYSALPSPGRDVNEKL